MIILNYNQKKKQMNIKKICKYVFELSKVCVLSISVGISFISIFGILSAILIPIIDAGKNNSDVDKRLYNTKLKKIFLKN